jgi:hypothetical protein
MPKLQFLKSSPFATLSLIFVLIFFLLGSFSAKLWKEKETSPICWDGFGYYFYLPTFFYDDFKTFKNYDYIQEKYNPTFGGELGVKKAPNGNRVMRYPIGVSFLMLPGFGLAHLVAVNCGYAVDGFLLPYQMIMTLWSLIVSWLGLVLLAIVLSKYFSDKVVSLSIIILAIGTNLYIFSSYSQLHSHVYLFFLYASIIFVTDSFYATLKYKLLSPIFIGLMCGIAVACRPTEFISFFIPLLWGVRNKIEFHQRYRFLLANIYIPVLFILFAFIGVFPQLLYWKIYSGQWLFYSYEDDQGFSFLRPHIINFLFSYLKGWFTYTPVMYIAFIGLFLSVYKRSIFGICVLVFTTFNVYFASSWDCWWYGGSATQRAMIQSYALLIFPIAFLLKSAFHNRRMLYFFSFYIGITILFNLFLTYQIIYCENIIHGDLMTKKYFWRVFGKTSVTKHDLMLLDTDEQISFKDTSKLQSIYINDFEKDSAILLVNQSRSGVRSVLLNLENQYHSPVIIKEPIEADWYRAEVYFFPMWEEWIFWKWSQFSIK